MSNIAQNIADIVKQIDGRAKLVAVSKTKPNDAILDAYNAGQRAFGENYAQELVDKQTSLPNNIEWHLIGHLQTNKVKYIAPFVAWIHAVDSEKLLAEINKQAAKSNRTINCLLQVHIAVEESKFGFSPDEIKDFCSLLDLDMYPNIAIRGLMGMASFTDDTNIIRNEFQLLKQTFDALKQKHFSTQDNFKEISMGMSSDWPLAIEEGSTIVRVGSAIFGSR